MSQPDPLRQPTPTIPAGWYFDGRAQRWWDGSAWGPIAPDGNDRSLATLAHVGALLGGFLVPLVLYLIADERRPETRRHARAALNFHITMMLAVLLGFAVMFTGLAASGVLGASGEPAAIGAGIGVGFGLFVVFFALAFAMSIAGLVFGIAGAKQANKGIPYEYPLCISFVRS